MWRKSAPKFVPGAGVCLCCTYIAMVHGKSAIVFSASHLPPYVCLPAASCPKVDKKSSVRLGCRRSLSVFCLAIPRNFGTVPTVLFWHGWFCLVCMKKALHGGWYYCCSGDDWSVVICRHVLHPSRNASITPGWYVTLRIL